MKPTEQKSGDCAAVGCFCCTSLLELLSLLQWCGSAFQGVSLQWNVSAVDWPHPSDFQPEKKVKHSSGEKKNKKLSSLLLNYFSRTFHGQVDATAVVHWETENDKFFWAIFAAVGGWWHTVYAPVWFGIGNINCAQRSGKNETRINEAWKT